MKRTIELTSQELGAAQRAREIVVNGEVCPIARVKPIDESTVAIVVREFRNRRPVNVTLHATVTR